MQQSTLLWIWLAEVCGPDSDMPVRLLGALHSIEAIYHADRAAYTALGFLKDSLITALCDKSLDHPQHIVEVCSRKNIGILTFGAQPYPDRLRRIQNPPMVLYYRGVIPDFEYNLCIAIVGTRGMTEDGRIGAYRIAYELAVAGAVIVSGMALGIDGTAQQAALDASGISIAVLGSAIDVCYPAEHLPLYQQLQINGGILSEYPPGAQTQRWNFPQRNRIISGLCQGTVVAEAGEKSGALITAKTAKLQGRDVYAVPGDPRYPSRAGTNALIKNGARPVTDAKDILVHYDGLYDAVIPSRVDNPMYYAGYDDRLRYAKEKIEERLAMQSPAATHPFRAETPVPPRPRTAPEQQPIREERHTDTVSALLNNLFPVESPAEQKETAPQITEQITEQIAEQITQKENKRPAAQDKTMADPAARPAAVTASPVRDQASPTITQKPAPAAPADDIPSPPEAADTAPAESFPAADSLTAEQQMILSCLKQRKTFDEICAEGMDVGLLMTNLTILELGGYIRAVPGGYYEII